MTGFTRAQLEAFRNHQVDDLIGSHPKLLFVGINPGLLTAATNTHFCHPSNRFYPALRLAGIIDWQVDPSLGLTDRQRSDLTDRGIAISNLVNRATARADELDASELREGATRLTRLVGAVSPVVVAVAGITAYRTAFSLPGATLGEQPEGLGESRLWVIPNPSGLNAHVTTADMATWISQLADTAGLQ